MEENIVVETNKNLGENNLKSIKRIIESKLNINVANIEEIINKNLIGGVIISYKEYKIVINLSEITGSDSVNEQLTIESQRDLSDDERKKYIGYSKAKFSLDDNTKIHYVINDEIIAGVRIRYKDEEIDFTLDKLLDKAFSKI